MYRIGKGLVKKREREKERKGFSGDQMQRMEP
jgi:hypothetical protein